MKTRTMLFRENLDENVTKEEMKKKILEDPDFIKSTKFDNSLSKLLSKNTKELENVAIGRLLMMTEEEVEDLYKKSVDILRSKMIDSKHEDTDLD